MTYNVLSGTSSLCTTTTTTTTTATKFVTTAVLLLLAHLHCMLVILSCLLQYND